MMLAIGAIAVASGSYFIGYICGDNAAEIKFQKQAVKKGFARWVPIQDDDDDGSEPESEFQWLEKPNPKESEVTP